MGAAAVRVCHAALRFARLPPRPAQLLGYVNGLVQDPGAVERVQEAVEKSAQFQAGIQVYRELGQRRRDLRSRKRREGTLKNGVRGRRAVTEVRDEVTGGGDVKLAQLPGREHELVIPGVNQP